MRDFQLPGRSAAFSTNAMVATSHPRATLTALDILRSGGNAVDAAVAAAGVLAVVEPQMTGIGGDCFVLYAPAKSAKAGPLAKNGVVGFNGSGRAPKAAETEWYVARGIRSMEETSPHSVTIPGAIDAWHQLVRDHGTKSLGELLQPAIDCAENGFVVTPRVALDWAGNAAKLAKTETSKAIFLPGGKPLKAGDIHRNPQLAATLKSIAKQGRDAFYTGAVAQDMVKTLNRMGALHTMEDFAAATGEYVTPISSNYRGYDVYECPPNGQGFVVLEMLNILQGFDFDDVPPLSSKRFHRQIEAARLAYRDRDVVLGDPRFANLGVEKVLSPSYAQEMRARIRDDRAMPDLGPPSGIGHCDTVYLCVVDRDGNAISFINSLYKGFGTGITSDTTGIVLHNRGSCFVVEPGHPNTIGGAKRPLNTIIPGMLLKDGKVVMPFGVMGGHYQPTGHAHLIGNLLDFGMDVQESLEAPRVFAYEGVVEIETGVPAETGRELAALGHTTKPAAGPHGGGQAVWIDHARGVLSGGTDPRKDGVALGY
ncbi:MAG: gamma-glutamyltransferase [Alphaproteobacteria bacterium]|nr:gamma-glutamyltransferase [Alphaproteobacteria bacterium]